jgi:SAM-dependent methyltransferase
MLPQAAPPRHLVPNDDGDQAGAMPDQATIASWDEVASLYGAGTSPFHQFAERLAQWADVRDGDRVLDVGCGNGFGLRSFAEREVDASLTGVDFSAEMLRACRTRLGTATPPLVRADVTSLPFASSSFEIAIASSVFQFVGYALDALREWRRVLASSGRLLFSVPAGRGADDVPDVNMTLIGEFFGRASFAAQQRLLALPHIPREVPDLGESSRAAGFTAAWSERVEFATAVPSFDDWWALQWTHGFRAFLREFDTATLEEMKARARELLASRCRPDGSIEGAQVFQFCMARN